MKIKACFFVLSIVAQMMFSVAKAQNFKQKLQYWNDSRYVSLYDFDRYDKGNDSVVSKYYTILALVPEEQVIDKIKYKYYRYVSCMDLNRCWVANGYQDSASVRLECQNAFDITELYARIATNDLWNNADSEPNEITNYYTYRVNSRIKEEKSKQKRNRPDIIEETHRVVEEELSKASVDPKYSFLLKKRSIGVYMSFCLNSLFTDNDYYDNAYGFGMNIGYMLKKRMTLGLDLTLNCFSEVKKEHYIDGYDAQIGDKLTLATIMPTFSYVLCDGAKVKVAPYVTGGVVLENVLENGEAGKKAEKSAFGYGVGCNFDFVVKRVRYVRRDFPLWNHYPICTHSTSEMNQTIRLRPYVLFADFPGTGKTRFFGFSLSYALMQFFYK
jgi:hypothetical protein